MTDRADHWAVWLTLLLCLLAFVLGMWLMPGPSDIDADRDTAASLQDAQQQAVIDRHMALALLASRSHK